MHYAVLTREEKAAALVLGYANPELWDCWQNHYKNFKWINLGVEYVQARQWWEALGWDILMEQGQGSAHKKWDGLV